MPLNFRAFARLALLALLPATAVLTAPAQNAFSPGGSDYSIAGERLGDQTAPHASVGPNGGWLVWQDNGADGNGLGIMAARLDAAFNRVGEPFRVNQQGTHDQEQPKVAMLADGGAMVVWQGGRLGFQKIYARVIGTAGQLVTGDVLVNTYTNHHQINPDIARLADGSVIVVWSSSRQVSSLGLYDVYAQRLGADGQKLGAEFRINQATLRNQRTPAVARLANGNYVVAWVSELQRSTSSVDVYARIFSSTGSNVTSELPVNPTPSGLCANPSIAASAAGGFAVAWSQKDGVFETTFGTKEQAVTPQPQSWDAAIRLFSSAGAPLTGQRQLNTISYGDQFAPKISAFGKNYLATWISLGHDSAREGVYGQFLDNTGALEGVEFRVNTFTPSRQIHPTIASDDINRFLVVWSGFQAGTSFDLVARNYEIIRVDVRSEGGSLRLTWNTQLGCVYQVQSSGNLNSWNNEGGERTATGLTDSVLLDPGPTAAYFRVLRVR